MNVYRFAKLRAILFFGILALLFSACNLQQGGMELTSYPTAQSTEYNPNPTDAIAGEGVPNELTPHITETPGYPSLEPNTPNITDTPSTNNLNLEQTVLQLADLDISYWTLPANYEEDSCITIDNSRVGVIVANEQDIFFVEMKDPSHLYKMSLDFSEKSVIYSSKYDRGFLNVFPLQLSQDWILFMDTNNPTGSSAGSWELIALNINSGQEITITDNEKSGTYLLNLYAAISGDMVYWTKNIVDENINLTQPSEIVSYKLSEGKESIEYAEKSTDHVITIPRLSNDYLVIERDPMDKNAPETIDIALLNLQTKEVQDIPYQSPGSMPQFQYPYILWKNNYRFDQPVSFTYYNMETNQQYIAPFIGTPNSDLFLYDRYPYARTIVKINNKQVMTLMIYDMLHRDVKILDPGTEGVGVGSSTITKDNLILNIIPDISGRGDQTTLLCKIPIPFSQN